MKDFGVIITCYNKDYKYSLGTLASVRLYLGDVPVCYIIDGEFDTSELPDNIPIIKRSNLKHKELEFSFGWGLTKMVAFWESPFEYFLIIEADIVLEGNILCGIDFKKYDFIFDKLKEGYSYSEQEVLDSFFDYQKLEQVDPEFKWSEWQDVRDDLFLPGILIGRKGAIPLSDYINLFKMMTDNPGLFFPGDQGILNYYIYKRIKNNSIKTRSIDWQSLAVWFKEEPVLKEQYNISFLNLTFSKKGQKVQGIHYGGPWKPFLTNFKYFPQPMTFFRYYYKHKILGKSKLSSWYYLLKEDWQEIKTIGLKDMKLFVKKLIKR